MIHIGCLIQQELDKQQRSQAWLAKAIHCTRPNIHKIISRHYIDTESLALISRALHHNFFTDLSRDFDNENHD